MQCMQTNKINSKKQKIIKKKKTTKYQFTIAYNLITGVLLPHFTNMFKKVQSPGENKLQ